MRKRVWIKLNPGSDTYYHITSDRILNFVNLNFLSNMWLISLLQNMRLINWKSKWQPIPVFLPGKSHGQRSLGGYSPRGRERVRHELATNKDNMTYRYSTTQSMNILSGWQIPSNPFPEMPYCPNLPAPAPSGEMGMEGWPCWFKGHNKDIF